MQVLKFKGAFAAAVLLGAGAAFAQTSPPPMGFFAWDIPGDSSTNFTESPFLDNSATSAAQVSAYLSASQASGKPLAIKVREKLTNPAALAVFDNYPVRFVFADYEDAAAVGATRALADQLLASSNSQQAFVGNFNFYPNSSADTTRPGTSSSTAHSYQYNRTSQDFNDARGNLGGVRGRQMANEALYPGAPDFRVGSTSTSPNIRSALFTLPIQRETFATNGLLGRAVPSAGSGTAYNTPFSGYNNSARHIPWVARFNNFGNSALDSDGNPANGYQFVTSDQLLSRGDFQAQILHYRLRGANSVNLFNDPDGSVLNYSDAQERSDIRTGWGALSVDTNISARLNGIFSRNNYAFANLTNVIGDTGGDSGDTATRSTETAGAVWSGVFDRSGTNRKLAILLSNLSNVQKVIDLPNKIGGFQTARNDGIRMDDFFLDPGQHKLITFSLSGNKWKMDSFVNPMGNAIVFLDNNRSGVGVPEPTTLGVLGIGALGLLARRRRKA